MFVDLFPFFSGQQLKIIKADNRTMHKHHSLQKKKKFKSAITTFFDEITFKEKMITHKQSKKN
jgi:hypothetical protein